MDDMFFPRHTNCQNIVLRIYFFGIECVLLNHQTFGYKLYYSPSEPTRPPQGGSGIKLMDTPTLQSSYKD
jgi:hypothetical protein